MNKRKPTKKKKSKTYLKTNEDPGRDLNKERKDLKKRSQNGKQNGKEME